MAATKQDKNLIEKLVEIASEIRNIEKGGRNESQKYSFVQEADVVRRVWPEFLKRGILFYPIERTIHSIVEYKTAKGADSFLTTVTSVWRALDDEGRTLDVASLGQGTDTGGDKGVYKALTGDKKYAVLQLLGIATGEDPEVERSDERETQAPSGGLTEDEKTQLMAAAEQLGDPDKFGQFIFDTTGKRALRELNSDDLAKILAGVKQAEAFATVASS
jgi:hypothetical protein